VASMKPVVRQREQYLTYSMGSGDDMTRCFRTSEVSSAERCELCYRLKREIIMIPNPAFQERLNQIHSAVWVIDECAGRSKQFLQQVSFLLYAAGEKLVGAYSTGQPIPSDTDPAMTAISKYSAIAKKFKRWLTGRLRSRKRDHRTRSRRRRTTGLEEAGSAVE
jgi:hypothetical protein